LRTWLPSHLLSF